MAIWRLRLLGELSARRGQTLLDRFPSRPVGLLLARLALPPLRQHSREELIELLWPEVDLEVGRNRLRQTLSTLRRLIEPADLPPMSVLRADRQSIALNAEAVSSDLAEFEQDLRRGDTRAALAVYGGELLPGHADEWVVEERLRLTALYERALAKADASASPPAVPAAPLLEKSQTSLPAYLGNFFGREREAAAVLAALKGYRLVTVCGLGGFGKTRLAVESAAAASGFDTVAFVPLAECQRASDLPNAVRDALGMAPEHEDLPAQLVAFLADRQVLLVLDNFEQLVESASGMLADLLERLPNLRALVTSRRALELPGEHLIALDALPVPEPEMDLAAAAASPSLALFIDRARGARADFGITEANRAALIDLARKLEGLPLAIEIAASRIRNYSPAEMLEALSARFSLLQRPGTRGARFGRHRSLQATIEWSWQLLGEEEQHGFAALSVLCGSWTADQACAVFGGEDLAARLHEFVSDSLLRAETGRAGETRFSMLETLRAFASEKLPPQEARALRQRHREAFLAFAERAGAVAGGIAAEDWPNCRAALASALRDGDPGIALELALALRAHWSARGATPEDLQWISDAVNACEAASPLKTAGHELLAEITLAAGNLAAAREHADEALATSGDDPCARSRALLALARAIWEREPQSAQIDAALDEAMRLALVAGDLGLRADALRIRGMVVLKHGSETADYAEADRLFAQAEALYRQLGREDWQRRTQLSRVGCLTGLGHYDHAEVLLAECESHFSAQSAFSDLVALANMRGYLESGRGRWRDALRAGRACVRLAVAHHARLQLTLALWNLPNALSHAGYVGSAIRLMGFAAKFWEQTVGPLLPADRETVARLRQRAESEFGAAAAARLFAEGAALNLGAALVLAEADT